MSGITTYAKLRLNGCLARKNLSYRKQLKLLRTPSSLADWVYNLTCPVKRNTGMAQVSVASYISVDMLVSDSCFSSQSICIYALGDRLLTIEFSERLIRATIAVTSYRPSLTRMWNQSYCVKAIL